MSRTYDTVLVVGAEKLSSITDWTDRNTCVLFGDGAGAAILQSRPGSHGLLTAVMGADGAKSNLIHMPGGAAVVRPRRIRSRRNFTICEWTAARLSKTPSRRCAMRHRRRCAVVSWTFRKSNASSRIRRTAGSLTRWANALAPPRTIVHQFGPLRQHVAASVAIALDEAVALGKIQRGDLILMMVFGSG